MSSFGFWFSILTTVPPLVVAVMLHEVAHGLAAERLGDPTARRLGRITLNPLKHIDPMMTVLIPGILILMHSPFVFGGAKPVPVNPYNLRNPRRDMAWVALAGPAMNFLLGAICYYCFELLIRHATFFSPFVLLSLFELLRWGVVINLVLGVFNLIPIPPLDGGRILVGLLPIAIARRFALLERYGLLIVVLLLMSGALDVVLHPIISLVASHLG